MTIFYLVIFALPLGSMGYPKINFETFYTEKSCDTVRDFYNRAVVQSRITSAVAMCVEETVPKDK